MKRINVIALFMLCATVLLGGFSSCSSSKSVLAKEKEKEYKKKMEEFKKGDWELTASSRTLEVALLTHYEKLNDEKNKELVGTSQNCTTISNCRTSALANASSVYAALASSHFKERIAGDMGNNMTDPKDKSEFEKIYAAYTMNVDKEIKGVLSESFMLKRKTSRKGPMELQVYYLVNEDAATEARIRAWENAKRESEAAQKYAESVSNFVREGFEVSQ